MRRKKGGLRKTIVGLKLWKIIRRKLIESFSFYVEDVKSQGWRFGAAIDFPI